MSEEKVLFLCGGVLFFLLTQATLPNGSARERRDGKKDGHSDPVLMTDLICAFTGNSNYGSRKDTSQYKDCLIEGSCNLPFGSIPLCTAYGNTVAGEYHVALAQMDAFVQRHIDPKMSVWLVKALLEILESDNDIGENDEFYIEPNGSVVTKATIREKCDFDLSAFLVGVLHYILTRRQGKNSQGLQTLDYITEKRTRTPRKYTGNLGDAISRKVEVAFLPSRKAITFDADAVEDAAPATFIAGEKPDDEVISEAIIRSGMAVASAMGSISMPTIDETCLENTVSSIAAHLGTYRPTPEQTDNMVKGASVISAAFGAQRHSLAERIRENFSQDRSKDAVEAEIPDLEPDLEPDQAAHEEKKTTIIHQQTNVIQNGDHNVNVTNNGTMNFNF